jgi:hypothetical protein
MALDEEFAFSELSDCERVEEIRQNGLIVSSDNLDSFFLWRAKSHATTCNLCQERDPRAVESLSDMITTAEMALVLEIDEIRGEHLREASAIARRAILCDSSPAVFASDGPSRELLQPGAARTSGACQQE